MLTITRRGFLGSLIGGVVAGAAVRSWPFRVFSFPSEIAPTLGATAVRFVKAYAPLHNQMFNRFDVLYGFGGLYLDIPKASDHCERILVTDGGSLSQEEINGFLSKFPGAPQIEARVPADKSVQRIMAWDYHA